MADDPFANYQPPKATDDPFANYKPPASSSQGWGDYLLQHLASAGQTVHNAGRAVDDYLTFGGADLGQSYLPMPGQPNMSQPDRLALLRGQTQAAHAGLGTVPDALLGAATYAAGPGELNIASKVGGAVAPAIGRLAGGVLGSGLEGAGASALGAAGHGDDVGSSALAGGGLGALMGGFGGVVGRGGSLPPAVSASDLKAQAQQAYAPLSNILYDATKEVHPSLDVTNAQNALRDWSGYKWNDAAKTRGEINTLLDKPQLSANDIQQSQSYLKGIAKNPNSDPNDALYAGHYVGQLQDVLENGIPQTGVPPNVGPGYAAQVKAAGDALHGRAQDVGRLNDWIAKSNVAGGPDVGGQASAYLRTKPGQTFASPGSPQFDALNTLAATNAGPDLSAAPNAWDVRHALHPLVAPLIGGALAGGAGQIAQGHFDPATLAEEAASGALLGFGLHKGAPWVTKTFVQGPAQKRAIDAARVALSTGQSQAPLMAAPPSRTALRNLIFGLGAGGTY